MPITPHFRLTQDDERVWVDIHVPNVRVSSQTIEVVVEDEHRLHFYSSPYLLVLTFPHAIFDDDDDDNDGQQQQQQQPRDTRTTSTSAQYDPMQQSIRLTLVKKQQQLWPDLDLLANLIRPSSSSSSKAPIMASTDMPNPNHRKGQVVQEILSSNTTTSIEDEIMSLEEKDKPSSSSWMINDNNCPNQDPSTDHMVVSFSSSSFPRYGFGNMFHHIFGELVREGIVFVELPNPDQTPTSQRRHLRQESEIIQFDPQRYLQDCQLHRDDDDDDYIYQCAMTMIPHWTQTTPVAAAAAAAANRPDVETCYHHHNIPIANDGDNHTIPIDTMESITWGMSNLRSSTTTTITETTRQIGSSTHDFFTSKELEQLASIPYPLLPSIHTLSNYSMISTRTEDDETMYVLYLLLLGLLDLLYAYVYDHLITEGEPTVESAWTVTILSCSLSWLDTPIISTMAESNNQNDIKNTCNNNYNNPDCVVRGGIHKVQPHGCHVDDNDDQDVHYARNDSGTSEKIPSSSSREVGGDGGGDLPFISMLADVVGASLRRTLIYPYIRNYEFGLYCWKQVQIIIEMGRRCILRCLLQMRKILHTSECHYLGNKLFVDPYLTWLQQPTTTSSKANLDEVLKQLGIQLKHLLLSPCDASSSLISKESLGLDLLRIEQDAYHQHDSSDNDNGYNSSEGEDSSSFNDDSNDGDRELDEDDNSNKEESVNTSHDKVLVEGSCEFVQHQSSFVSSPAITAKTDGSLLELESKLIETESVAKIPTNIDSSPVEHHHRPPRLLIQEF